MIIPHHSITNSTWTSNTPEFVAIALFVFAQEIMETKIGLLAAASALLLLLAPVPGATVDPDIQHGMDMTFLSYDIVCWYLNGKQLLFDQTHKDYSPYCTGGAGNVMMNLDQFNGNKDDLLQYFGQFTVEMAMSFLPHEYNNACNPYLLDPKKAPPSDESYVLNDNETGDYPWKGFAYCMVQQFRNMFGDKAIQDVVDERTHGEKDWRQTILDHDNAYRAHHGAEPFTLDSELNAGTQAWADGLSRACLPLTPESHTPEDQRGFRDFAFGENIAGGKDAADKAGIAAYHASNSWYGEVDNWPDNGETGHFTQTIWRDTKFVGYGFAPATSECDKSYFVGRYYPPGNVQGGYDDNVFPAIS